MELTGLLLCAGLSARMGYNKTLLNYNNSSFISNILFKMNRVCSKLIVVTGYQHKIISKAINEDESLKPFIDKVTVVENENYIKGMFTSLKQGIKEIDSGYILYHFVDNPSLPLNFYIDFQMQVNKNNNWFQPVFGGKKGHPIIIDDFVAKLILAEDENSNLKSLSLNNHIKKFYWVCDYPEILYDIDTPADYKMLKNEDEHIRKNY
ncbi:MAG: NTP transferase domain-containing protein [Ignavibacteriaceae bacterium]|nr:NTP transferase domain-containing protein [Ignavibacteriaceae bacterium]